MKRRELLRRLEALGCHLEREGGNHSVYLNPRTGQNLVVPRHNEVNDYIARKLLKLAEE